MSGDTFFAVIEFSTPQRAEVLLNYGNWSKTGLGARRRSDAAAVEKGDAADVADRKDIEANLESRKVF